MGYLLCLVTLVPCATDAQALLTSAAAVRELSPQQAAERRPVRLVATVTLWNPGPQGEYDLFIQDETAGVYLTQFPPAARLSLVPGDRVEVDGFTDPGTFAPCVAPTAIRKIGHGPLPEPEPHSLDPDDNRWLDSRYVQVWAFVQSVTTDEKYVRLRVATAKGNGVVLAAFSETHREKAATLVGRVVRVRGVNTSPQHNPQTRLAEPIARIHVQSLSDVEVSRNLQETAPVPIAGAVRGFVPGPAPFARPVTITGIVTLVRDTNGGQMLAIQDQTGAAFVRTSSSYAVRIGDPVTATGYLDPRDPGVVLVNASVQHKTEKEIPPPAAHPVTSDQILRGRLWGELIRVEGVVESVTHHEGELLVKCHDGPHRFLGVLATTNPPDELQAIVPGSRVSFVGVCSPLRDVPGDAPVGFRLHLRSQEDVTVLEEPTRAPWWTARQVRNLTLGIGGVGLLVAVWVLLLRRQIRKQTAEIRASFAREAELERSLQEPRRLEAVGRLVSGIAHDFNNLLTVIVNGGELAAAALPEGHPATALLATMRQSAQRAADLTRQLLTFARESPSDLTSLDLNTTVSEGEALVRRTVGENIKVIGEYAAGVLPVRANAGLITQIVLNLAVNARDAMPEGGELVFRTSAEQVGGKSVVRFTVSDTGCGMDEATQARIFEPFFTTKEFGKGTGLGLATVYGIVRNLGGTIRVCSAPGQGTTFTIDLPAARETPPPQQEVARTTEAPSSSATILLVDDDVSVREMCAAVLRQYGFEVVTADTPQAALELVQSSPGLFNVLVTDAMMPTMSGPELAAAIRTIHPTIRVLVISGYPREEIPQSGLLHATDGFLQKPFTPVHLVGQVHAILGVN